MVFERNKDIQPWSLKELREFSKKAGITWSKEIKLEPKKFVIWAEEMDQGFGPRGIYHLFDLNGHQHDIQITRKVLYPDPNRRPKMETCAKQGSLTRGKTAKPKTKKPKKETSKPSKKTKKVVATADVDGRKASWNPERKKAQAERMRAYWAARKAKKNG